MVTRVGRTGRMAGYHRYRPARRRFFRRTGRRIRGIVVFVVIGRSRRRCRAGSRIHRPELGFRPHVAQTVGRHVRSRLVRTAVGSTRGRYAVKRNGPGRPRDDDGRHAVVRTGRQQPTGNDAIVVVVAAAGQRVTAHRCGGDDRRHRAIGHQRKVISKIINFHFV